MNAEHMRIYARMLERCENLWVSKVTRDGEPGAYVGLFGTIRNGNQTYSVSQLARLQNTLGKVEG